jgi:hypothetical protein
MLTLKKALILALACALVSCSWSGNSDDPVGRSLGWFNFLNGTDLRQSCGRDGVDRYRFVYNGRWGEQVRIYEITRLGRERAPSTLEVRVLGPDYLRVLSSEDLLQPWRGVKSGDALGPAALAKLETALGASGFDEKAPRGLTLPSDGFYWVAAACRNDVFHFNAWNAPSERFQRLAFPAILAEHDRTGIAFNDPHPVPTRLQAYYQGDRSSRGPARGSSSYGGSVFDLEVGDNGLKGVGALF